MGTGEMRSLVRWRGLLGYVGGGEVRVGVR